VIPFLLLLLLPMGTPAASASDVDPVAAAGDRLAELAAELDGVVALAAGTESASWEPVLAIAVASHRLARLELALAHTRLEAAAAMESVLGMHPGGGGPDGVGAALLRGITSTPRIRARVALMGAWDSFQESAEQAVTWRDQLRSRLGLPAFGPVRVCPLEAVGELDDDWGDPRGWRRHRGNDVHAPEGTPLLAMEDSVVVQMGWHWAGGNGIYLLGAVTGDTYYYAHLLGYADGIDWGVVVPAGSVIGYVGSTGNADLPHLHLGWMPAAGGVDLNLLADGYPMLRRLCG
jgi:murein DD-endopeptidase MepM/ murein hydrolase activator NlpD